MRREFESDIRRRVLRGEVDFVPGCGAEVRKRHLAAFCDKERRPSGDLVQNAPPRRDGIGVVAFAGGQNVEVRLGPFPLRAGKGEIESRLPRKGERGQRGRLGVFVLAHETDGVHAARRQFGDWESLQERREIAHLRKDRLRAEVLVEEPEFAFERGPGIRWKVQMPEIKGAPPEEGAHTAGPRREERGADASGGARLRADISPHVAGLLRKARLAGNAGVEERLRRGVDAVAKRVKRLVVHVRRPKRIRVRRQQIHKFALVAQVPRRTGVGAKRVHPADDRPRRVLETDRRRDLVEPRPRLLARGPAHAVALVADIPSHDGGAIPRFADEPPHEPDFPHPGDGIGQQFAPFEGGRNEQPPAHPSRENPHDEPKPARLRHVAKRPEAGHHLQIDALRILERPVVLCPRAKLPAAAVLRRERLEIRPKREDAQDGKPVSRKRVEIPGYAPRIPSPPHHHAGMRRPVVATDGKTSAGERTHPDSNRRAHFPLLSGYISEANWRAASTSSGYGVSATSTKPHWKFSQSKRPVSG